ncbi:glucosamine-6-phosphate deaminase [Murinocardiopsis flavida]|uniref:Glucosamine-6-phosphate deaminase n=1 Tax=Murinocardiopsis flavida TaxID=645275 RepID=A0A2P8CZ18_9ACTN|nr:6-phosphogluconolactonase [Murinocardiopsis flavida]PSK90177.1 glucosamine-6-phosphate deaminase [Murinocardiopsis flavida]
MSVPTSVFATPAELGAALATEIADGIAAAQREGRRYVLGCPGGRTPRSTYQALARTVVDRGLGLSHVVIAMMDDYAVPAADGGLAPAPADAHYSCARFARTEIAAPLSAAAADGGIGPDRVWLPDPADPARYDDRLADAGGVDLFILASGASDGHVAFNPPGTPFEARSRTVELADTTRQDNLVTFPDFGGLDDVPRHGVTVGPRTIADQSRRVVMVVHGDDKRAAAARISAADGYEPEWPATVIAACTRPDLYVDAAADR